jgi:hypothetical protein
MNSDAYSFAKSSAPQGVDAYTPYADKQWQYINDINGSVYTPSNTLVQVDMTQIFNSGNFCPTEDLYLAIPIVLQAAWVSDAGVLQTPTAQHASLCSMKTNFAHLVHQIEVVANGKTVSDTQPFCSLYQHFKLASQMSQNDVRQYGPTLGFAPAGLDNERSVQWAPLGQAVGSVGQAGRGLINNSPFGVATLATDYQSSAGLQNSGSINTALTQRATRLVDATATTSGTGNTFSNLFGTSTAAAGAAGFIMSPTQLANEGKGYYSIVGNSMVWQDVAIIPLKHLCDCIDKMGLVKKLDMVLRLYLNTGTLGVAVAATAGTSTTFGAVTSNTFVNTVPFSINFPASASASAGAPTTGTACSRLVCALSIARSNGLTIPAVAGTATLPSVSHYLQSVRCYYSLVKLEPSRALAYIEENRAKQVVYENILFNQYNSIPAGGTFSQLVQSGIKNPLGICMIPLISGTTVVNLTGPVTLASLTSGEQFQSPYDMCPGTFAPISLTNLQCALGGVNMLQSSLYYTWENFLEQVALAESLTSTDMGIGTGLISQSWWEMNRVYYVDLARGREADKASMRNLTISFNNNSLVPITLMVFTVYLDKLVVDVETGAVRK